MLNYSPISISFSWYYSILLQEMNKTYNHSLLKKVCQSITNTSKLFFAQFLQFFLKTTYNLYSPEKGPCASSLG